MKHEHYPYLILLDSFFDLRLEILGNTGLEQLLECSQFYASVATIDLSFSWACHIFINGYLLFLFHTQIDVDWLMYYMHHDIVHISKTFYQIAGLHTPVHISYMILIFYFVCVCVHVFF